jgi:hypothetical protein
MIELDACRLAALMVCRAGFERRYTSMQSEAVYYSWPGRIYALRIAAHKTRRNEYFGVPVVAHVTFNFRNFKLDRTGVSQISKTYVVNAVASAIGRYHLITTGCIRANGKYRSNYEDLAQDDDSLLDMFEES